MSNFNKTLLTLIATLAKLQGYHFTWHFDIDLIQTQNKIGLPIMVEMLNYQFGKF